MHEENLRYKPTHNHSFIPEKTVSKNEVRTLMLMKVRLPHKFPKWLAYPSIPRHQGNGIEWAEERVQNRRPTKIYILYLVSLAYRKYTVHIKQQGSFLMFHPAFSLHTITKPCTKHHEDFEQTPHHYTPNSTHNPKRQKKNRFFSLVSKKRFQKNSYECMKLLHYSIQHSYYSTIASSSSSPTYHPANLPSYQNQNRIWSKKKEKFFVCSFSIYFVDVVVCCAHSIEETT